MYEMMWFDKELDEICYSITNDIGRNFLLSHPEEFEIFYDFRVE